MSGTLASKNSPIMDSSRKNLQKRNSDIEEKKLDDTMVTSNNDCVASSSISFKTNSSSSASHTFNTITPDEIMGFNVGDIIQCTTRSEQITGELIQIRVKTGVFLLREQKMANYKSNLHFINAFKLNSLKKLSSCPHNFQMPGLPFDKLEMVERRLAIAEYKKSKLWVDDEMASEQGKRTFMELKRIFDDVIWDNADILILKCVRVHNPYDGSAIETVDSKTSSINTMARIEKILQRQTSRSPTATTSSSISDKLESSISSLRISISPEK